MFFTTCNDRPVATLVEKLEPLFVLWAGVVVMSYVEPFHEYDGDEFSTPSKEDGGLEGLRLKNRVDL